MIAKKNETINKAVMELAVLSQDEKNRMVYEMREKERMDREVEKLDYMKEAEERVKEAEERVKEAEERTKQVFKLSLQNKTPEEIAKLCDLSLGKVLELLN